MDALLGAGYSRSKCKENWIYGPVKMANKSFENGAEFIYLVSTIKN
jgi:hypothetical protein